MGHSIEGTGANARWASPPPGPQPWSSGTLTNVTIRNLSVRHWGDGIRIGSVSDSVVEDVVAEQNGVGLTQRPPWHHHREQHTRLGLPGEHRRRDPARLPGQGHHGRAVPVTGNGVGSRLRLGEVRQRGTNRIADCDFSGNTGDGLSIQEGHFSGIGTAPIRGNGDDGLRFRARPHQHHRLPRSRTTAPPAWMRTTVLERHPGNWITGNDIGICAGGDSAVHVWNNLLNNTEDGISEPRGSGHAHFPEDGRPEHRRRPVHRRQLLGQPERHGLLPDPPRPDHDGICDEPYLLRRGRTDFLPLAPRPGARERLDAVQAAPRPRPDQAEDYDVGGEGVAYHDTTPGNRAARTARTTWTSRSAVRHHRHRLDPRTASS